MSLFTQTLESPVGPLSVYATDTALVGLYMTQRKKTKYLHSLQQAENRENSILAETHQQLLEYFNGQRSHFKIPLSYSGSDFQKKVWASLITISLGDTRSYSAVAQSIGHPQAVRAVGSAIGSNPISIIIPCHRVLNAQGQITGYAGGSDIKKFLLLLESKKI